jgi:hypothetical protein
MSDVTRVLDPLVEYLRAILGNDMTFSIIMSRITREARRLYGIQGAQDLLRRHIAAMPQIVAVEVVVPDAEFRIGPSETAASDLMRAVIDAMRQAFGDETAFSIILGHTIKAAQGVYGVGTTQQMLRGLINTMPEAAEYDRS